MDVVELTQQLVRIPSVNPMGLDHTDSPYLEWRVTEFLEQLFTQQQIPSQRQYVLPKRDNIVALFDPHGAKGANGLLLLEAHQDTVPVTGMIIEPFSGKNEHGKIWGRGSCDIKGGMATMLAVCSRLMKEKPADAPTILMACTINEENGFDGIQHLAESWSTGQFPLLDRLPDAAIVAEPTELNVVVAHKGTVRWKCHTTGKAAHSSSPDQGENAFYTMARVLTALEKYANRICQSEASYPLLTPPSLSVGTIAGGVSVNTVPDHCTIEIDRRLWPNEDADAIYQEVIQFIQQETNLGDRITHDPPYLKSLGLASDNNQSLSQRFIAAVESTGIASHAIGVPFGTNAGTVATAGIPTIVFGPGSIEQAHTADEWIAIDQLRTAEEILFRFCANGLK